MDDNEVIRRLVLVDGISQREVARRLNHSRKTVRKALAYSKPPGYRRRQPAVRPVLHSVEAVIEAWLEEDKSRPRKQRHTARRIYERLRDEHGFEGSYSAVRRFVQKYHATRGEVYFPLSFDPGEEAQVDWGEGTFLENGVERKVFLFSMRLCYSGASFVYPYPRMTQEALLDGHVRAFAYFGKVPRRLAYDNLKAAVVTVGKGQDRALTEKFKELRSHYLFETRFCNVACGNEKGHVENLVKWSQRNLLTPLPAVSTFKQLSKHFMERVRADLKRPAARSGQSRGELLKEELARMLPLPEQRFLACKEVHVTISKQALIRFDNNDYSAPVHKAFHNCLVRGFVDRVELYVKDQRVASHNRCYEKHHYILDFKHYIPLLETKPGGLQNAQAFKGAPWGHAFARMLRELEYRYGGEGTRQFIKILLLFERFAEQEVKEAVQVCVRKSAFSADAVQSMLNFTPPKRVGPLDLSNRPDLREVQSPPRPLSIYDALNSQGVI